MTIVQETTNAQDEAIARIAERWRDQARRTDPIQRHDAEIAMSHLYRYMHREPPEVYRFYESPEAALSDFPRWRASIGRVTCTYWLSRLPICDPLSFYGSVGSHRWVPPGVVDLGVRRSPNTNGAFVYQAPLENLPGALIARGLLDEVWNRIVAAIPRGPCDIANEAALDRSDAVVDELENAVRREAPASQVKEYEYIAVGALRWLICEAACSETCRDVLEARINPEHVAAVSRVAQSCGLVYAFERLCVICDRPQTNARVIA